MSYQGHEVVEVRRMTDKEFSDRMGWYETHHAKPYVLVLDDGTVLFPACDLEGNAEGAFHGVPHDEFEDLEGAVIASLAPMSDAYMDYLDWGDATDQKPTCITFEDGHGIYPARDPEGNDYGALFAYDDTCGDGEVLAFA